MGTGPFVTPKLPGVRGLGRYRGHTFHTSRWDYSYTGGSPSACGGEVRGVGGGCAIAAPLDRLGDKRVAIVGTGATSVQCIPHLAAACKELLVFQRTPSSVDVRGNIPTDPHQFAAEVATEPGWQTRWMENFVAVNTGRAKPGEQDLVKDGWTDLTKRINRAIAGIPRAQRSARAVMAAFEASDNEKMTEIRRRCDAVVDDPATAAALKAWYRQRACVRPSDLCCGSTLLHARVNCVWWSLRAPMLTSCIVPRGTAVCKRPTFHDEYLQAFNRPSVTLVDTTAGGAKGVEQLTVRVIAAPPRPAPAQRPHFLSRFSSTVSQRSTC